MAPILDTVHFVYPVRPARWGKVEVASDGRVDVRGWGVEDTMHVLTQHRHAQAAWRHARGDDTRTHGQVVRDTLRPACITTPTRPWDPEGEAVLIDIMYNQFVWGAADCTHGTHDQWVQLLEDCTHGWGVTCRRLDINVDGDMVLQPLLDAVSPLLRGLQQVSVRYGTVSLHHVVQFIDICVQHGVKLELYNTRVEMTNRQQQLQHHLMDRDILQGDTKWVHISTPPPHPHHTSE